VDVDVYDPWASPHEVMEEYGIGTVQELPQESRYNVVVLAVAHKQFDYATIKKLCNDKCVVFDVKAHFEKELVDARL
jgi:UDP-N-acetyl-D-glucosamine/UDP-N-acetyl-D-galactosamine dehydrogenase